MSLYYSDKRATDCSHWMLHTVYGSRDRSRNGTFCQLCGKKRSGGEWRHVS